jgi:FAD/FMN-containing dehydrogenase
MEMNQTHPSVSSATFQNAILELKTSLPGIVFLPADPEYSKLSQPFNLSVVQHPALIISANQTDDIVRAVGFARDTDLGLAILGGAHGTVIPADGAVLINTRQMKAIQVDSQTQTARIETGAKWGEVLLETQAVGLAPLLGSSPDVGVAGYTLGGGMGWLARKYGLAADNVLSFEMVTASGEIIRASQ